METFEFSNNSIGLLVSVFSTIIGMTYPLLLQAIQKIDEQYKSVRISKMFKEEPCFRHFQILLIVSIAMSFVSVFIMEIFNGYDTCEIAWVTIHSLVTLALLCSIITLFNLILVYFDPQNLLKHIKDLKEEKKLNNDAE